MKKGELFRRAVLHDAPFGVESDSKWSLKVDDETTLEAPTIDELHAKLMEHKRQEAV